MRLDWHRIVNASLASLLALSLGIAPLRAKDEKPKAADVVAKHLEALGTAEARAAAKTRAAQGPVQVVFRLGGSGQLTGNGLIASEGRKARIEWKFQQVEYPGEQLAFDGSKLTVGQVRPGVRSPLTQFVYQFDFLMKEGLLGGALSTGWALLETAERQPKIDYSGTKKIDGVQLHELKYRSKKGSGEVQVSLFFEPENWRHVRSQFRLVIPARMGSNPADSAGQRETIHQIVEQFSDFKAVDGLTLPHSYRLQYTVEAQNSTYLADWTQNVTQMSHNQAIEPKVFSVQ
jgi:hypothetical protein